MIDFLEDRPLLYLGVIAVLLLVGLGERWEKRRRGTWVPLRKRPMKQSRPARLALASVMTLVFVGLGTAILVGALDRGRAGEAITGAFLLGMAGWLVWVSMNAGRDVTQEERASTRWKRPWIAWYVAIQGGLAGMAGVLAVVAAYAAGYRAWWLPLVAVGAVSFGVVFVRLGLRMRVADVKDPSRTH